MVLSSLLNIFGTNDESHEILVLGTGLILFSQAFMDVIVDGLLINQQKIDPEYGSEDLTMYA